MTEIAVILPLEPMEAGGTFVLSDIPLHLTVLSNAVVDGPADGFEDLVQRAAAAVPAFSTLGIGRALFGAQEDILVTEVEAVPELQRLHDDLREAVVGRGGEGVQPTHWGAGYRPHVTTTQSGKTVDPGQTVSFDRIALIDCSQVVRRVVWVGGLARSSGR